MAEHPLLYAFLKPFFRVWFDLYHRTTVEGLENLPPQGPVIVACNHCSYLDPPFVGAHFPWRLHYLAKEELFKNPLFGGAIAALGAIPVPREDVQKAGSILKLLVKLLEEEKNILVFPEGKRSETGRLGPLESGVAFLSLRTGAPIIPAYLSGTFEAFPKGKLFPRPIKIHLAFGRPIWPTQFKGKTDREIRGAIMEELERVLKELEANRKKRK